MQVGYVFDTINKLIAHVCSVISVLNHLSSGGNPNFTSGNGTSLLHRVGPTFYINNSGMKGRRLYSL